MMVGLAMILAVVLGAGTTALAANGKPFVLGKGNVATKVSALINKGAGPALGLKVRADQAPLTVNPEAGTATNLSADELDGKDASDFAPAGGFGAVGVIGGNQREGTFNSKGGTLSVSASGSAFRGSGNARLPGRIGVAIQVDGTTKGTLTAFASEQDSHETLVDKHVVLEGLPAGDHTIRLAPMYQDLFCDTADETINDFCTTIDQNDFFSVAVVEIPR